MVQVNVALESSSRCIAWDCSLMRLFECGKEYRPPEAFGRRIQPRWSGIDRCCCSSSSITNRYRDMFAARGKAERRLGTVAGPVLPMVGTHMPHEIRASAQPTACGMGVYTGRDSSQDKMISP
jgi:hypothetical protein